MLPQQQQQQQVQKPKHPAAASTRSSRHSAGAAAQSTGQGASSKDDGDGGVIEQQQQLRQQLLDILAQAGPAGQALQPPSHKPVAVQLYIAVISIGFGWASLADDIQQWQQQTRNSARMLLCASSTRPQHSPFY
jgi:hypothetical protein